MSELGDIEIELYPWGEDPNIEAIDYLWDITQESFSREGVPTKEDFYRHISEEETGENLTVSIAEYEGNPAGFASVESLEEDSIEKDLLVLHGGAVKNDENLQGEGLASALLNYATVKESNQNGILETKENMESKIPFGARVQSLFGHNYVQGVGECYPKRNETTPEELTKYIELLSGHYDSQDKTKGHVASESYPKPLYNDKELSSNEEKLSKLVNHDLNLQQGDGMLITGEISIEDLVNRMQRNKDFEPKEVFEDNNKDEMEEFFGSIMNMTSKTYPD